MIGGSPALERSLRRRIRGELRASKPLWREYKNHKKARPRVYRGGWVLRLLVPFAGLALGLDARRPGMFLLLLGISALYAAGSAFLRASNLIRGLWASQDLMVLSQYPLPDQELFRLQWKKFIRSSLWILYTFALFYASMAVSKRESPVAIAAALVLGILQWVLLVGTATGLAAWRPQWPLHTIAMALFGGILALVLFNSVAEAWLARSSGLSFLIVLPGWLTLALRDGVLGHSTASLAWAAPAVAAGFIYFRARNRLRSSYTVWEIRTERPAAEMLLEYRARQRADRERSESPSPASPARAEIARQEYLRSIPAGNEDRVRDGTFLPLHDWSHEGFLERVFMKTLTRRERVVAELMAGPRLRMTRKLKIAAGLAILGITLATASPQLPPVVLAILAGMFGLTVFQGDWPGFRTTPCAGKFMPIYAVQPVEYGEISKLFFKMTLTRLLLWTPLAAALGAALGHRAPALGAEAGFLIGLKAAWIALSIQPIGMLARFSSGSNDTERLTFRGCFGLILPFALLGIPLIAAAAGTFAIPNSGWLLSAAAVPLLSWALWAYYGFLYNRCRIDLIRSTTDRAM